VLVDNVSAQLPKPHVHADELSSPGHIRSAVDRILATRHSAVISISEVIPLTGDGKAEWHVELVVRAERLAGSCSS
jgi:hypothetical protein